MTSRSSSTTFGLIVLCTIAGRCADVVANGPRLDNGSWKLNGLATQRFEIRGTGERNNPLRQTLVEPFTGDEVFVRYRLRYDASTIDTPVDNDGEFFVLWMDSIEGNDSSGHAAGVPNFGLHVSGDENRFMLRFGANYQKFAAQLKGDQDYLVVGRLWKSVPGADQPFDRAALWIDPTSESEFEPHASTAAKQSVSQISWIGFSTGRKTEIEDRIAVWDIDVAATWEAILGLPPKPKQPVPLPEPTIDFTDHVFPILKAKCFRCHAGEDAKEGIRLDVLDEILNQTTPRDAAKSHLIEMVADGEMPPEGEAVTDDELQILSTWIDEGLDWDEQLLPTPIPTTTHWAFQPIRRPEVPAIANVEWVQSPVDAFIARQHERLGLKPASPADQQTLNRRLSLDVLGLPVGHSDVANPSEEIDKLLSNVAFGERWGRHWLDVARWAESNGHQHNRERPYAWRYRDWVINAMATDKPFDEFVREQLAGDELVNKEDPNLSATNESLIVATGFLSAARYSGNELDKDLQRNEILTDITNTTASAFLALTLECAQCHTHKFDPISIRDYYRFQAAFAKGQPGNVVILTDTESADELIAKRWEIFDKVHTRMVANKRRQGHPEPIYVIPKSVIGGMTPQEKKAFNELEQQIASLPQSWSFYSPAGRSDSLTVAPHEMRWPLPRDASVLQGLETALLIRGDVNSPGPIVEPGWPAVFGPTTLISEAPRSELAAWMTSKTNPLVARVWVNRIWQWHFGRGLVETSSDFGTQGTLPSHPQLLDFLASELIDNNWSSHHVHRLILKSATYRQSSQFKASNFEIDPDNKFLWRWLPRRLEAEAVRDSILAVSDQLDSTPSGPSSEPDSKRRSIYLKQRRDNFPHQQILFDSATGITSCAQRRVSTTALQPLWLMNDELVQQAAKKLAERAKSVDRAMQLAVGRKPTDTERATLTELADEFGLQSACLAILNSSEFLYIP